MNCSPEYRRRTSLHSVVTAVVGGLILGVALTGCDTPEHSADKQAQADIAAAQSAEMRGDETGVAQARSALEKASTNSDITSETKATAKSALARIEAKLAVDQIQQIDSQSIAANQLIGQIEELAQQIMQTHAATVAYDKFDPKPAHDAIAADIAAVQGSASKPDWLKEDGVNIPSLAFATQEVSRLQGLIATQHDQQKSLEDRKSQTLGDAEAAAHSADASKGQQSVDEYKRASNLRKQAGDLSIQIDKTIADTKPLDDQLAVAQSQQTLLTDAVKQMQAQSDALDTGWKSLVEALSGQAALAKQIATASPTPSTADPKDTNAVLLAAAGASLNDKAEALGKLLDQIKQERTQAEVTMRGAIQHFNDAASAAQSVFTAYEAKISDPSNSKRPELESWKDLEKFYSPTIYKLSVATAQRRLAAMYLTELLTINARQQMQQQVAQAMTAAALDVPPALADATLDAEKTAAAASASTELAAAVPGFDNLTHGTAPAPIPSAAKVDKVIALYSQVQVARAIGDSATAQSTFKDAVSARDDATGANITLPPLPADLKSAPAATPAAGG